MRDIGVDVKTPEGEWDGDENCPFNGSLRVRGQIIDTILFDKGKDYGSSVINFEQPPDVSGLLASEQF